VLNIACKQMEVCFGAVSLYIRILWKIPLCWGWALVLFMGLENKNIYGVQLSLRAPCSILKCYLISSAIAIPFQVYSYKVISTGLRTLYVEHRPSVVACGMCMRACLVLRAFSLLREMKSTMRCKPSAQHQ
jgi:hypothetical protein